MLKSIREIGICVALAAIAACAQERSLHPPGNGEGDPRAAARARRMDITVSVSGGDPEEMTVRELTRDFILEDCFIELAESPGDPFGVATGCSSAGDMVDTDPQGLPPGAPPSPPIFKTINSCEKAMCRSLAAICASHRLLELSTAAAPVVFRRNAQEYVTVPPQDTESNIWFAEDAWHYAAWSVTVAGDYLKGTAHCTPTALAETEMAEIAYEQHFASGLAEALVLADESARAAIDFHKAVAEADFARTPDIRVAAKFAWIDKTMSATRASHFASGSGHDSTGKLRLDEGLAGFPTDGICPVTALTDGALLARDIIRFAGPHPSEVADLTDPSFGPFFESAIRPSLAERFSDESIGDMTAEEFLASNGITEQDFLEARTYLAEEAKAFARETDGEAQLPPQQIASERNPDGTLVPQFTEIPIYAATATAPSPPPAVHLRGMSRFASTNRILSSSAELSNVVADINDGLPTSETASVVPSAAYARAGLPQLFDYAATTARSLLGSSTLSETVLDTLAGVSGSNVRNARGRVETCYRYYNPGGGNVDELRIRVYGAPFTNVDEIELLSGVPALRCAVEGEIEGTACEAEDMTKWGTVVSRDTGNGGAATGYLSYGELIIRSTATAPMNKLGPWLYLVRRAPEDPDEPGFYEALGAIRLVYDQTVSSTWRYCSLFPINPDADALAEAVLGPSTDFCGRAANSCAGPGFADRIPLESELSSDNDAYESSWRVYLERAKEAADRADQLGELLIESGLELDRRTETAEEELEALCGGPISLFDQFATPRGDECSVEGQTCVDAGYSCQNGFCVLDPVDALAANTDDPIAQRLAQCLGVQGLLDYAALGSSSVCIWKDDTTGALCEDPEDEVDGHCPYLPTNGACGLAPGGATAIPVTTTLRLFDDGAAEEGASPACSALRSLRDPTLTVAERLPYIGTVSRFFIPTNVERIAARVGWEARPDDYSAITVDGIPLWATGDGVAPGSTSWPCTNVYANRENPDADETTCCTGASPCASGALADSLFCASISCGAGSDDETRAIMNHRMARAVIALRILAGVGLGAQIMGPFFPAAGTVPASGGTCSPSVDWENDALGTLYDDAPLMPAHTRNAPEVRSLEYKCGAAAGLPMGGRAVCLEDFDSAPDIDEDIWTAIGLNLDGDPTPADSYQAACDDLDATWIPMFVPYPDGKGTTPSIVTAKIWHGLDGNGPTVDSDEFHEIALKLLLHPPEDLDTIKVGNQARITDLTSYYLPAAESTSWDENEIAISKQGIAARDILDAMELACEVERLGNSFIGECPEQPPAEEETLASLAASQQYLRCKANDLLTKARRQVLVNVPQDVVAGLLGSLAYEGERGAAAGEVASALLKLQDYERNIENALADLASDFERLRLKLALNENARQQLRLQRIAASANLIAGLASSLAGMWTFLPNSNNPEEFSLDEGLYFSPVTSTIGGIAGALNAVTQFEAALEDADIGDTRIDLDDELTWEEMKSDMRAHAEAINDNADELQRAIMSLRSALARMETQRAQGLRNLAKGMMLGTTAAGTQFAVNTTMRRRYNTLRIRYENARRDAVKMAWLARRAIEQRIGFRLEDLYEDMTLVEAPARWADAVCTSSGIDYARIRDETQLDADDYADAYIGDYVRKLERVMQSYEHDFPFADAADTAVISMRDDITSTRDACEISVPNVLAYSARLDVALAGAPPTPVWETVDCEPLSGEITNCIGVDKIDGTAWEDIPIPGSAPEVGQVPGYRITFGPTSTGPGTTSFDADSALIQRVTLDSGYYRLSWYGRQVTPPSSHDPADAVIFRDGDGDPLTAGQTAVEATSGVGWERFHRIVRVSADDTELQIAIVPMTGEDEEHEVDIAGLMLEDVTAAIGGQPDPEEPMELPPVDYPPSYYVATIEPGVGASPVCEDSTGRVFRNTSWLSRCVKLCDSGFGSCDEGEKHCFREMLFSIDVEGIERGGLLQQSGFAYGNYNYRMDAVAVNLVGTGLRDCEDAASPETCYSSGSIPYSLVHYGPYMVRNHRGDLYEAPLFTGRIEHGRALAAERYISNPISTADRALLQDYWHRELRGRPITGNFGLRIWESDEVVFENLVDVQLVLDYRYWTRFE